MDKMRLETGMRQEPEEAQKKELGLYLHIPFCVRKCDYCDFLSAHGTEATKKEYVEALLTEIESYQGRTSNYVVGTIFFGGGTPSCIPEEDIERIMAAIRETFSLSEDGLEATIEVNPGTVTRKKLEVYRRAGINRISFGLQSTKLMELKKLGRIHSYEDFLENYQLAREVGFSNINVDLMSALPGQTLSSWEETLYSVAKLNPEHISAYSLIIEEGTKFYDRYHLGAVLEKELPDEDTDRLIYHRTKEILEQFQYLRYEISNYAKAGYECRHNNSYWIGTDYLGLGLGSSSLLDGARFTNNNNLKQYLKQINEYRLYGKEANKRNSMEHTDCLSISMDLPGIRKDYKRLTREEQMEEFMYLGLRRCEGVRKEDFHLRFGEEMDMVYGRELEELIKKKLIEMEGDILRLTDLGIDVSNQVLSEFLL